MQNKSTSIVFTLSNKLSDSEIARRMKTVKRELSMNPKAQCYLKFAGSNQPLCLEESIEKLKAIERFIRLGGMSLLEVSARFAIDGLKNDKDIFGAYEAWLFSNSITTDEDMHFRFLKLFAPVLKKSHVACISITGPLSRFTNIIM